MLTVVVSRSRAVIGAGGDHGLSIEGVSSHQVFNVLVFQSDDIQRLVGSRSQVHQSGGGGARHTESGVDLAILHALGGVRVGLVNGVYVVKGHAKLSKNLTSGEVVAGTGSADGNGLTLQVSEGLDVGIQGEHLDHLVIQGTQGAPVLIGVFAVEQVSTSSGIVSYVVLDNGEVDLIILEQLNVSGGGAGRGNTDGSPWSERD